MMTNYLNSKEIVKKYKLVHQKCVDDIIQIMKPIVKEKYYKDATGFSWEISNIDFCNDEEMKDKSIKYEWVEISEDEYYKLSDEEYKNSINNYWKKEQTKSKLKDEYTDSGDHYYNEQPVKYEYLRVGVSESWRYGGRDYLEYDFLLTDIMDNQYVRKQKLKQLEKISK